MPLKTELLLAFWVAAGIFTLYIGAMTLKNPNPAVRKPVFTGAVTLCIGALLLGLAGWVGLQRHADATATTPISYRDPTTGKYVTRDLTPEEARQLRADPDGFMTRVAPALEKKR